MTDSSDDFDANRRAAIASAAERALAEARLRHALDASADAPAESGHAEIGGPRGPEPTRFGDWERKGVASDF